MQTVKVERVGRDAYEERPAPTLHVALGAYELRLKALGLMAPAEVNARVTVTETAAGDEERVKGLEGLIEEARAEVARLKAKKWSAER